MTARDDVLRAAVYAAYDRRDAGDEAGFAAACARVVAVHRLWPLVEYEQALIAADTKLERRRGEYGRWVVETADRLCRGAA